MKQVDFARAVEESVALVGLVARLQTGLEKDGQDVALLRHYGARARDAHTNLIRDWQCQCQGVQNTEGLFSLFRACREIINPVQSLLQNGTAPGKEAYNLSRSCDLQPLLRAIICAKEEWAYIDAHPQLMIRR